MSLLIQGTSITQIANLLRLSNNDMVKFKDFGVEIEEDIKYVIMIDLTDEWFKKGNLLKNITLPEHTHVMMIKRGDGKYLVPNDDIVLTTSDKLMVITTDADGLL